MKVARAHVTCGAVNDERAWRPWRTNSSFPECPSPEFLVANPGVTLEVREGWLVVSVEGEQDTYVPMHHVRWVEPVSTEQRHQPERQLLALLAPTCVGCREPVTPENQNKVCTGPAYPYLPANWDHA